jgi:hypothetical protein
MSLTKNTKLSTKIDTQISKIKQDVNALMKTCNELKTTDSEEYVHVQSQVKEMMQVVAFAFKKLSASEYEMDSSYTPDQMNERFKARIKHAWGNKEDKRETPAISGDEIKNKMLAYQLEKDLLSIQRKKEQEEKKQQQALLEKTRNDALKHLDGDDVDDDDIFKSLMEVPKGSYGTSNLLKHGSLEQLDDLNSYMIELANEPDD